MENKIISSSHLNKTIIILIIPIMIEMLLETMLGYVNVSMLGRLDKNYLAASELSNSLIYTCLVLANSFSLGGTVLVSKYVGSQDDKKRNQAIGQTILIGILFSLLFYLIFLFFTPTFLKLMGASNTADAPVLDYAILYMKVSIYTIPILMFRQMFAGILRGMGKTKFPMYLSALNIILNIIFNFIFIYDHITIFNQTFITFGLLIRGAAISTLISRGVSLLLLILYFAKVARFDLKLKDFLFTKVVSKEIFSVGLPTALEMMIFRFGMMYYLSMVASLGATNVAAHSVAGAAESFSYTPGNAFNIVIVTLVGQFLGARRYDMAQLSIKKTDRMAIIFMGFCGLLFIIVPNVFVSLFTSDKEVISIASKVLRIQAIAQVFFARFYVYSGLMRTIGKSKQIFFVTTTSVWFIRIPLTAYFINHTSLGLVGAWIPMCLDFIYRAVFITILTNYHLKKIFGNDTRKPKSSLSLKRKRRLKIG